MRIAVSGQLNLVNDAARDMGFIRTREQRAVVAGLGFAWNSTVQGAIAGDTPSIALRRVAGGTRVIHVPFLAISRQTAGNVSVFLHNAAIAGETVVDPAAGSNRLISRPNAPEARQIEWQNQVGQGVLIDQAPSLAANTRFEVEAGIEIDGANQYVMVDAAALGVSILTVNWRWYEE